jgi:hypothetical protein
MWKIAHVKSCIFGIIHMWWCGFSHVKPCVNGTFHVKLCVFGTLHMIFHMWIFTCSHYLSPFTTFHLSLTFHSSFHTRFHRWCPANKYASSWYTQCFQLTYWTHNYIVYVYLYSTYYSTCLYLGLDLTTSWFTAFQLSCFATMSVSLTHFTRIPRLWNYISDLLKNTLTWFSIFFSKSEIQV